MPVAYLPSPASAIWHLGMIPVRAYALCMVAGVLVGLWLTDRRYRKAGYQPGVILDMATIAVPVGLIGARIYSVLTNFHRYFGPGRDWTDVLRVWDGGMGVAGAVAAGALADLGLLPPDGHRRQRGSARRGARAGGRPGDLGLGQLVQPGAVRAAVRTALGRRHRPAAPRGRIPAVRHLPAAVPVRIAV